MKLFIIIASIFIAFTVALPALGFELSQGIVGNLSKSCRVNGDCGWCDFIDLIIILQKVILSLFGGLALIMLIWGGQGIITAAGNQQKVAEAKKLIVSTLFGVFIILVGYFLITILVGILVTPAGQKIKIGEMFNGKKWLQAFCLDPSSESFCQERSDGFACNTARSSSYTGVGTCKGGVCITNCEYQFGGEAYSCKTSSSCQAGTIKTGLCPGPTTWVCCK